MNKREFGRGEKCHRHYGGDQQKWKALCGRRARRGFHFSWCYRDAIVTCKACLAVMKAQDRRGILRVNYGE